MTRAVIETPSIKLVCGNDSYPEGLGSYLRRVFQKDLSKMIEVMKSNKDFRIEEGDLPNVLTDYFYYINEDGVRCVNRYGKEIAI